MLGRIEKIIPTKSPLYVSVIIEGKKYGATTKEMDSFKTNDYVQFEAETQGEFTNIVNIEGRIAPVMPVHKSDIEEMKRALDDAIEIFKSNELYQVFDATKIALSLFIQRMRKRQEG